jgi:hypothetical protein
MGSPINNIDKKSEFDYNKSMKKVIILSLFGIYTSAFASVFENYPWALEASKHSYLSSTSGSPGVIFCGQYRNPPPNYDDPFLSFCHDVFNILPGDIRNNTKFLDLPSDNGSEETKLKTLAELLSENGVSIPDIKDSLDQRNFGQAYSTIRSALECQYFQDM